MDTSSQAQPGQTIESGQLPNVPNEPAPSGPANPSHKKLLWLVVAVVVVLAGAYGLYAYMQKSKPKAVLRIAVMGTFSGDADTGSYPALRGAQLAKKDLNAVDIELIQSDTQCDEELSPEAMNKLVEQKVVAVIGDACSSSSLAALPIANQNKIVMISPTASSISLSTPGDYFFRVVPPDIYQGEFLAKLLADKGMKKVAIVYSNENYGKGLTEIFKENFTKLGGTVVASEAVERESIDVATQVAAVKASNPEAIVILNNSFTSGVAIMKQARAVGMQVPFFAGDGIYDSSLLTEGGDAANGLIVTTFATGSTAFTQSYAAEYGEQAGNDESPQAYDAFKALYLAIQKGARTGEEIAKTLPSISFDGVTGKIAFDENGDVSQDYQYTALQVTDGKFVPQE